MIPLVVALVFVTDPYARWEKEVSAIEARVQAKPGGIVFAGSSSIRLWNLRASFPERTDLVNVGFGGSQIRDVTHFAGRLIVKHAPRQIVFYAGDNDIASNRTPKQLRDDYAGFAKAVHAKLPTTAIVFLAVKPSVARWKMVEAQRTANQLVKEFCAADERLQFADVGGVLLGADGKPEASYFVKDGLHLAPSGYARWTSIVGPMLR